MNYAVFYAYVELPFKKIFKKNKSKKEKEKSVIGMVDSEAPGTHSP